MILGHVQTAGMAGAGIGSGMVGATAARLKRFSYDGAKSVIYTA